MSSDPQRPFTEPFRLQVKLLVPQSEDSGGMSLDSPEPQLLFCWTLSVGRRQQLFLLLQSTTRQMTEGFTGGAVDARNNSRKNKGLNCEGHKKCFDLHVTELKSWTLLDLGH
ncbi:uncharacterized protein V6R79_023570 [Siganus canaliculatus]